MFLQRLPSELSPVFRLLDDYNTHCTTRATRPTRSRKPHSATPFTPKFDIRESNDCYYLDGELSGLNQEDIQIEFTDPHTLVIKGHSQRGTSEAPSDDSILAKSYQPTVVDEEEEANSQVSITPEPKSRDEVEPSHRLDNYLVAERVVGDFYRTFIFSDRINQEGVKARLKSGILSVEVPREKSKAKKVRIE